MQIILHHFFFEKKGLPLPCWAELAASEVEGCTTGESLEVAAAGTVVFFSVELFPPAEVEASSAVNFLMESRFPLLLGECLRAVRFDH